jgi:hypothetical protein
MNNGADMLDQYNHKLKTGLTGLGCSALSFAALAAPPLVHRKISQQTVSQIMGGTKDFDSPADAQAFLDVIATMEYLQNTVTPRVPINWANVLELKDVLAAVHEQRQNDLDPLSVQNFYIRISRLNFFKQVDSTGIVSTINPEKDGAAFQDIGLVQKTIAELKKMGTTATHERLTGPRRKSTIVTSLEEVGLKSEQAAIGGENGRTTEATA